MATLVAQITNVKNVTDEENKRNQELGYWTKNQKLRVSIFNHVGFATEFKVSEEQFEKLDVKLKPNDWYTFTIEKRYKGDQYEDDGEIKTVQEDHLHIDVYSINPVPNVEIVSYLPVLEAQMKAFEREINVKSLV